MTQGKTDDLEIKNIKKLIENDLLEDVNKEILELTEVVDNNSKNRLYQEDNTVENHQNHYEEHQFSQNNWTGIEAEEIVSEVLKQEIQNLLNENMSKIMKIAFTRLKEYKKESEYN